MKKLISLTIITLCLLTTFTPTNPAQASAPIKVFVNGNQLSFTTNPYLDKKANTTLVEFRPVFESLGLKVGWDQKSKTITGTKKNLNIKLKLGSKYATVNGQNKELATAPKLEENRTLVPLRFVGESSNNLVNWNGDSQVIQIATNDLTNESEIYQFTNFNTLSGNGYSEPLEYENPFTLNDSLFVSGRLNLILEKGGFISQSMYDFNSKSYKYISDIGTIEMTPFEIKLNDQVVYNEPGFYVLNHRSYINASYVLEVLNLNVVENGSELIIVNR